MCLFYSDDEQLLTVKKLQSAKVSSLSHGVVSGSDITSCNKIDKRCVKEIVTPKCDF